MLRPGGTTLFRIYRLPPEQLVFAPKLTPFPHCTDRGSGLSEGDGCSGPAPGAGPRVWSFLLHGMSLQPIFANSFL